MPALKNPRHERFVQELAKGRTALDAYQLAGYKPHKAHGARLRQQPAIERRYQELIGNAARLTEVTAASVINELAAIAFANIADYVTFDADGQPRPDLTRLTREQSAALVEVSADGARARRIRFKLADKRAALSDLGRMLGLFRERVELSGVNGKPIETREMSDFEAARRIAFILAKAAVDLPGTEAAADGER